MDKEKIEGPWESPDEAVAWCNTQPDPLEALMQIVRYNMRMDEYGFASELVYEAQTLKEATVHAYTVLLLYPMSMTDGVIETYMALVYAADPDEAISKAREEAKAESHYESIELEEFECLTVIEGHHQDKA